MLLGGVFLLSTLITLIILITADPTAKQNEFAEASQSDFEAMSLHQFMLPPAEVGYKSRPYLWRERIQRWADEQVERYWIPLNKIVLEIIIKENDKRIEEIFEGIP